MNGGSSLKSPVGLARISCHSIYIKCNYFHVILMANKDHLHRLHHSWAKIFNLPKKIMPVQTIYSKWYLILLILFAWRDRPREGSPSLERLMLVTDVSATYYLFCHLECKQHAPSLLVEARPTLALRECKMWKNFTPSQEKLPKYQRW